MRKNKTKIILIAVIAVLSLFALTACGRVDFTYYQNSDGTYTNKVVISLDGDMTGTDMSLEQAMNYLEAGFTAKGYFVNRNDENMVITATKDFLNIADLQKDVLGNGLSVSADSVTDENSDAFTYRQDIDGTPKISTTFFINSMFLVKSALVEGGLNMEQADKVLAACGNMKSTYTFVTPQKSVVTNADSVTRDKDGNYVHYWELDDDQQLHIQLARTKKAIWFAIAIIAAASATLIGALYLVLRDKFSEKRAKITEEE